MATAADFVAEPPALPPHIRLTPLDLPLDAQWQEPAFSDGGPRPSVPVDNPVLNPLYICSDEGSLVRTDSSNRVLLLGSCTRYKGKHTIMTLLYKPVPREHAARSRHRPI